MSVDEILRNLNVTLTYEIGAKDIRNRISKVRVSIENQEDRDKIISEIKKILTVVENPAVSVFIRMPVERELGKVLNLLQPTEQLIEGSVQPKQGKPETLVALLEQMKRLIETTHQ